MVKGLLIALALVTAFAPAVEISVYVDEAAQGRASAGHSTTLYFSGSAPRTITR